MRYWEAGRLGGGHDDGGGDGSDDGGGDSC